MKTRVLLYEDNSTLRNGLDMMFLLNDEIELVGSFGNCIDIEAQTKELKPDVILMDIDMPEVTGVEGVKKVRTFNKKCIIIMLTVFDDNKHVFDAICAGASGYLLKKDISDKLLPAIEEALNGGAPMSPAIARMIIQSMQRNNITNYNFTNREQEILELLCKGNSYKMIANELNLTFETVRSYIKNVYLKLDVHSGTEAVSKAINEKLI